MRQLVYAYLLCVSPYDSRYGMLMAGLYKTYPSDRQQAVKAAQAQTEKAGSQSFAASGEFEESSGLLHVDDSGGGMPSQLELAPLRQEAFFK